MSKKTFLTCVLAAGIIASANAIPAKRGLYTVQQPDGTTITIQQVGDENFHLTLTDDNKIITLGDNGVYQYARIDTDGSVVATGVKAVDSAIRPASHLYQTYDVEAVDVSKVMTVRGEKGRKMRTLPVRVPSVLSQSASADGRKKALPQTGMGLFSTSFPNKGKIKGLVILAQFRDSKFQTSYANGAHAYFEAMMQQPGFSESDGTGSAHDYFYQMSMGQFDPQFDVVGPVTLPQNCSYYGGNDSYGDDKAPEQMIIDACRLVDSDVNFADYDNDNDGYVDNVFVFYAGRGEASGGASNTVWPHSWEIESAGKTLTLDGKRISRYACSNEWEGGMPDGVGTFVHEFSHVMGLPDLYCTSSSNLTVTPDSYSCMDYGPYNNNGRTPPAYSIYERNAMGWIEPQLLDGPASVTLEEIQSSNAGCIIQTEKNNEFFLLENRQQTGWDTYLPGHGMLIWHIDFVQSIFDNNTVNNTRSHQYVDIVEANNYANNQSSSAMAGYPWPGTSRKTEFSSSTTPALKSWAGKAIDLPLTDITEQDGVITFDVAGGNALPAPETSTPAEVGEDYFVASWKPVEGAIDYYLTVMAEGEGGTPETETAGMGSGSSPAFPEGWTSDITKTYTTTSNYGESAPSLRFDSTGKYLQTREYSGDIVKFSYWIRPMSTSNSGTCLKVTGLKASAAKAGALAAASEWVDVTTITPTASIGTVYTFDEMPAGIKALKFTMEKHTGNIALDDLTITTGGSAPEVIEGYDGVSTAGATSMRVSGLPVGNTKYSYYVIATDGVSMSRRSNTVAVTLNTSAVDDIVDTDLPFSVAISGRTLTVSGVEGQIEIYNAMGVLLTTQRASYGTLTVDLPAQGVYIVRNNAQTAKVLAH